MTKEEYLEVIELAKKKINQYIGLHSAANYDPGVIRKEDDFGYWVAVSAQEIFSKRIREQKNGDPSSS